MTAFFKPATCFSLLLLISLFGCGGGGSDGGTPQDQTAPPTPQQLNPTWTLERALPDELGASQAEVDAVLNHIFGDPAVQSATLVKDGYIIGERFSSGASADSFGTSCLNICSFSNIVVRELSSSNSTFSPSSFSNCSCR